MADWSAVTLARFEVQSQSICGNGAVLKGERRGEGVPLMCAEIQLIDRMRAAVHNGVGTGRWRELINCTG